MTGDKAMTATPIHDSSVKTLSGALQREVPPTKRSSLVRRRSDDAGKRGGGGGCDGTACYSCPESSQPSLKYDFVERPATANNDGFKQLF